MATGLEAVLAGRAAVDQPTARKPLTTQQEKLVEGLALGLDIDEAGQLAGYSFKQASHRAAHLPHVQAALLERVRSDFVMHAGLARRTLTDLARTSKSERTRAEVASKILERVGMGGEQEAGPAIALQLVIGGSAGNLLATRLAHAPQPTVIAGESEVEHSLAEGERPKRKAKAARDPAPAPKRKPKRKAPRGQKRAAKPTARGT